MLENYDDSHLFDFKINDQCFTECKNICETMVYTGFLTRQVEMRANNDLKLYYYTVKMPINGFFYRRKNILDSGFLRSFTVYKKNIYFYNLIKKIKFEPFYSDNPDEFFNFNGKIEQTENFENYFVDIKGRNRILECCKKLNIHYRNVYDEANRYNNVIHRFISIESAFKLYLFSRRITQTPHNPIWESKYEEYCIENIEDFIENYQIFSWS
jgi:hypothetical protein